MKIDERYTFNYIFIALVFIVFGAILTYFSWLIGLTIITAGIVFLFVKTGTIFNIKHKKIGRYSSLFGKGKILWTNISKYHKAHLDFEFISQKMNSRGTSSTMKTKTYKLRLIGEKDEKLFHEYSDYKISKQTLEILRQNFGFEIVDKYAEAQKEALIKRSKRKK